MLDAYLTAVVSSLSLMTPADLKRPAFLSEGHHSGTSGVSLLVDFLIYSPSRSEAPWTRKEAALSDESRWTPRIAAHRKPEQLL